MGRTKGLSMMPNTVDIAGTGFTAMDRVYTNNEKVLEALGGSCGNVLLSLAMLERSVVPLLSLGHDAVGNSLIHEFMEAGADTSYITRRQDVASPVLAQRLDLGSRQHSFSFVCPETNEALPRYRPIDEADVDCAKAVLDACAVFYADRLTDAILRAMEMATQSGALVFFEPSSIDDENLFARAIQLSSIVKYSFEQLSVTLPECERKAGAISIVTHGADGLEVDKDGHQRWCAAIPAAVVIDTCGAGDMVSVGIIDWILAHQRRGAAEPMLDHFLSGVVAGQRLAAVNCAYGGARGVFKRHGADGARLILDGRLEDVPLQCDLFESEPWFR
jgi:fructokinase